MFRTNAHYGWKPDLPDQRDLKYGAIARPEVILPQKIDLRPSCPLVYDQGQLASCTGNAIAAAFEFVLIKENAPVFTPSRLFIYYNERSIEDSIDTDSGAQIRDGIKSISNLGVCPETMWPYIPNEFAQKPFAVCYASALQHTAISYERVSQDLQQMKSCLAEGFPFVAGFTVYDGFESQQTRQTGLLNMPGADESMVGGHAVLVVGYDDSQNRFIVRNSWGDQWGMSGYFTMPYEYLMDDNLASDFWTIRITTINPALRQPGARGHESGILPGLASAVEIITATLSVTFNAGQGKITATLNRGDGSQDSLEFDSNGGSKTFDNVFAGDNISLAITATGSVDISIDRDTDPKSPLKESGNTNRSLLILS